MKIGLCGTMSVGKTTLVNRLKVLGQFKSFEFEQPKKLPSLTNNFQNARGNHFTKHKHIYLNLNRNVM